MTDLDVIGAELVGAPAEAVDPLDLETVGADTFDLSAHRAEHPTQPLHVRL